MAPRGLSTVDVERLTSWPADIAYSDLVGSFTPSIDDVRWVRSRSTDVNQLGLAVQLCGLRFLGFLPEDLAAAPEPAVDRVADKIGVDPGLFGTYCAQARGRTRRDHVDWVLTYAGWTSCGPGEWKQLGDWLVERALEHDTHSVLFRQALDHLRAQQVVRPGLDRLMRAIGSARATADAEVFARVKPVLTSVLRGRLDSLVETDTELGVAPLVWLATQATTASPAAIAAEIEKRDLLEQLGAHRIDGLVVGPNGDASWQRWPDARRRRRSGGWRLSAGIRFCSQVSSRGTQQ